MNNADRELPTDDRIITAHDDAAPMTTTETLSGIFLAPSRTFDALRAKPRFAAALLLMMLLITTFGAAFTARIGYETIVRARIEANPRVMELDADKREEIIAGQTTPFWKTFNYVIPAVATLIIVLAGAGLYLGGALAMGGRINYKQALAVYSYSSLPPTLLFVLGNVIVLYLKSRDDLDPLKDARGVLRTNPGFLVDGTAHPVVATLLGNFDVIAFYGLFLAALGLRRVGKMSSASAWGVVLTIFIIGLLVKLGFALMSGSAM